jgi:hypothetical protein
MAVKYNRKFAIFVVEYLREYEPIFETPLAHETGDPGVQFDEKL